MSYLLSIPDTIESSVIEPNSYLKVKIMEIERLNVTSKFMDSLKKFSDDQFTWGTLRHLINALKEYGIPSDTV